MTWISVAMIVLSGAASADVDAFFKDYTAKRDTIQDLEAHFVQKTILPDEILTTEGELFYVKPRRILFRTLEPERTTLVDGARGYEYEPDIKQLLIYDMANNPQADIFFLGFDNNTDLLRERYDLELFTPEDTRLAFRGLVIRPKADAAEEAGFEKVTLYLREEDYLPTRIHIVNDEETELFIDIEKMKKNSAPPATRSQIFAAEGTKIVVNDRVVETVGEGGKHLPQALVVAEDPPVAPEAAPTLEMQELDQPVQENAP